MEESLYEKVMSLIVDVGLACFGLAAVTMLIGLFIPVPKEIFDLFFNSFFACALITWARNAAKRGM